MNKIEIRGVIVPSEWDVAYLFGYIQRGIITPESRIRKLINEADSKKPIELYINSPGGSVFAGNEMINALLDWKTETGQMINTTVGAMAASMGSAILVSASDSVKVHSNTKIMFHGAWGGHEGGAESFKDYSELLNKINADIKVRLVKQYGLNTDQVNEWFKEGREGWLTADEAKACGMANEIIGELSDLPESADNLDSMMNEHGMKIAALTLNKFNKPNGEEDMNFLKKLKEKLGLTEEISEDEILNVVMVQDEAQEGESENDSGTQIETEESENEESSNEGSEDSGESGTTSETDEDNEEASETEGNSETEVNEDSSDDLADLLDVETMTQLQDQAIELSDKVKALDNALKNKQSENDKLKVDMVKLSTRVEKLLGKGGNFVPEKEFSSWSQCLADCDGDYVKARKTYPNEFRKFMGLK